MDKNNNTLDSLLSIGQHKKSRSNILTPLLWLASLAIPLLVIAFNFKQANDCRDILVSAAMILIFIPTIAFIYFMFKEPDRLHSETYLIQKQELQSSFALQMQSREGEPKIIIDNNITPNPNNANIMTSDRGDTI